MPQVRISINRRGIGELLTGDALRADLSRRAERVASAARADLPTMHSGEIRVEASTDRTRDRVRGVVVARHPGVLHSEAKYRFMGRAIDAAGD